MKKRFLVLLAAFFALCLLGCGSSDSFQFLEADTQYEAKALSKGESWEAIIAAHVTEGDCSLLTVTGDTRTMVSGYLSVDTQTSETAAQYLCWGADGTMYGVQDDALVKLSSQGQALASTELTLSDGVTAMTADEAGNVYIAWNEGQVGRLAVYSPALELLGTVTASGTISAVAAVGDTVYCLVDGQFLTPVDGEAQKFFTPIDLGQFFETLSYDGESLYLSDSQTLWRADLEGRTLEAIFALSDAGIGSVLAVGASGEDGYLVVTNMGVYRLSVQDDSDSRVVLRVAADYCSDRMILSDAAIRFNSENPDYRVEITTVDDETAFLTQLTTGDVPDMFYFASDQLVFSYIDARTLGDKGYLLDMYTLLEGDEDYPKEAFVQNILQVGQSADGGLYQFPLAFGVDIGAVSQSVVGDITAWTPTECLAYLQSIDFSGYILGPEWPQSFVLSDLVTWNWDSLVDSETGTCNFDSEEFKAILQLAKDYAPETSENVKNPIINIQERSQLYFDNSGLYCISAIGYVDEMVGDPVYIGYPAMDGGGNMVIYDKSFAISSSTEYPEAVWEFAKLLFDEQYRESLAAFPVVQTQLDDYLENATETYTMGEGDMDTDPYAYLIEVTEVTEKNRESMRTLINSLDKLYYRDGTLMSVVKEIAQEYFAGQKTVDETAKAIQSRVSIYLSERMGG
jgi:ABC-type glycerol-3-phosphate transport system substrate-binding protein